MKQQVELLFEEYLKIRRIDITIDHFIYLINLYPSLLVCMSDGVLDKEEWDGIESWVAPFGQIVSKWRDKTFRKCDDPVLRSLSLPDRHNFMLQIDIPQL